MMNFGPLGSGFGGNSSPSSSNLSALAPPFTVDRLNPNFNSNPLLHYSDSPYVVEPINHAWQYARPSAPGPEHVIASTGETRACLSDGYGFSVSASQGPSTALWSAPSPRTKVSSSAFAYGGEINPYRSPYVPPLVTEDNPVVPNQGSHYNVVPTAGMSRLSQLDYNQNSVGLEYGPRWADSLGFEDGKRAKRVELDGGFFSDKANAGGSCSHNPLDQRGYNTGAWNNSKEEPDFSYQKFNQVYGTQFHTGAVNVGHMADKHIAKDFCLFSDDSKKTNILESSSIYQESHPLILTRDVPSNASNYQSSYTAYDKCSRPDDTAFAVSSSSVMRPSPAVVIRPPPATSVNIGQSSLSHKPVHVNNGDGVHMVDFGDYNLSKQKNVGIESSFKINEDDLINFSKQGDSLVPSTSVKELSSALHYAGMFDHKISTRRVPQLTNLTVSGGSAMACDNDQVSDPADLTSDFVGVDSPCWKGAPYSKISQFDVESGNIKNVEKNFGEYCGFDQEESQNLHPIVGSDGVSSEETGQGSKKNQNESARMDGMLKFGEAADSLCSSNKQSLLDDVRSHVQISTTTSSKGVKICADTNVLRKESTPPNNPSGFVMKDCDTKQLFHEEAVGMTPTHASEGGDVAVHAAEKVLYSPVSRNAAIELRKLPDPKFNVPTMITTMHNLSELLLFHLTNQTGSLDGEIAETLKYIIINLNFCLSKKTIRDSDKPESNKTIGVTSEKLGESCDAGAISESQTRNEAVNSNINLKCGSMHGEVGTVNFSGQSGKEDKKLPKFSSFMDDLDMRRDDEDDDTAKAIKKILEENFHFDEEMYSQAFLFKSLWLEAEAKLCSVSYKARFDRMKNLMEEAKLKAQQASEVPPKACVRANPKSTLQDYSVSGTSGHADVVEASVMERFSILKSREENPKPVNVEEEQQPEIGNVERACSAMARFNVLKSRKGNSNLISVEEEEEQETDVVDGEHATSVIARYNILKSREGNSNLIGVEEKQKPNSQFQIGSVGLDEGKFGPRVDEFHLTVKNGSAIRSSKSSNTTSQDNPGSCNGSSDWEHVLKDDASWKNS